MIKKIIFFFFLLYSGVIFAATDNSDYILKSDDIIYIEFGSDKTLSKEYEITESGYIELNELGKIYLSKLSLKQAEQKLKKFLDKY
jgi:protein involved in polysaccharide export with SLBB domain